jgi:hypothetical protein
MINAERMAQSAERLLISSAKERTVMGLRIGSQNPKFSKK